MDHLSGKSPVIQPAIGKSDPKKNANNDANAGAKVKTTKRNVFRLSNLFSSGKKESANRASANYDKPIAQNKALSQRSASKPPVAASPKPAEKLKQKQMDKFLGQVLKNHGKALHEVACANRGAMELTGNYETDVAKLITLRFAKEKSDAVKKEFMSAPDTRPQVTNQTARESFAKSLQLNDKNEYIDSSLSKGVTKYYNSRTVGETIPTASDSEKRLAYTLDYVKENESRIIEMTAEKPFQVFWTANVVGKDVRKDDKGNPQDPYNFPSALIAGTTQTITRLDNSVQSLATKLQAYRGGTDPEKKKQKLRTIKMAAQEVANQTDNARNDIARLGKLLTTPDVIAKCPEEHRELLEGLGRSFKDIASELKSDKGLFAVAGNLANQILDPNEEAATAAINDIVELANNYHVGPAPPNYIPAGPPTDDASPPPPEMAATQSGG